MSCSQPRRETENSPLRFLAGDEMPLNWDSKKTFDTFEEAVRYHQSENVPQQHTVFVNALRNVTGNLCCYVYGSRDAADMSAGVGRIACFPVTFTEGEGLE